MHLILNSVNQYDTMINLDNFDMMEIAKHNDSDFRICVRRFQLLDDPNSRDGVAKDLSLTIGRYRTIIEATEAFNTIIQYLDIGIKNMYCMPKDTAEYKEDDEDEDNEDIIKETLMKLSGD